MAQVCVSLPKKAARYEAELDDRRVSLRQSLMRNFPQSDQLDVLLLPLYCAGHRHHSCATKALGHHCWHARSWLSKDSLKGTVCIIWRFWEEMIQNLWWQLLLVANLLLNLLVYHKLAWEPNVDVLFTFFFIGLLKEAHIQLYCETIYCLAAGFSTLGFLFAKWQLHRSNLKSS